MSSRCCNARCATLEKTQKTSMLAFCLSLFISLMLKLWKRLERKASVVHLPLDYLYDRVAERYCDPGSEKVENLGRKRERARQRERERASLPFSRSRPLSLAVALFLYCQGSRKSKHTILEKMILGQLSIGGSPPIHKKTDFFYGFEGAISSHPYFF